MNACLSTSYVTAEARAANGLHPEILAHCPDAQEVKLLQGGKVNQCFRIFTQAGVFAFRLGVEDPARYGFSREEELRFYCEAERLGIAPKLESSNPAKGILVMEYIDGDLVTEESIRRPEVFQKVIALLHTLHAQEAPGGGEGKTIEHIRFFINKLKEHNALPVDWEDFFNRALQEMPTSRKLVLCHNDLAYNLMIDSVGRLLAIDFECAGWNDPVFDLAFLCIWYEFSEQEKAGLLASYAKEISMQDLNCAVRLGLLFSALWSRLEVVYGHKAYEQQANELYEKALKIQ